MRKGGFAILMILVFLTSGHAVAQVRCQIVSEPGVDGMMEKSEVPLVPYDDCREPPIPPPPPPPDIPLDDMFTQIGYGYTVRSGDYNGDGRKDLYIKRNDGNMDNDVVYEALATQDANGYFTVLPNSSAVLAVGRQWPTISVLVRGGDANGDGYSDPALVNLTSFSGYRYAQTFISSGKVQQRNAVHVSAHDEEAQRFVRDLRASAGNPDYWDAAKGPDEAGYNISVVLEGRFCVLIYGWPYCWVERKTVDLGFISLKSLGLAKGSNVMSKVGGSGGSTQYPAVSKALDDEADRQLNKPEINTYIGSESAKQESKAYFGLPANKAGTDDVLYCVWYCGYYYRYSYYESVLIRWYDVWTPAVREGAFDDVNYSRDAFEFVEGEIKIEDIVKQGPSASSGAARNAVQRIIEIIFGVGGDTRPIDSGGPYIETEIIVEAARRAKEIAQEIKHRWLCAFNDEDPEACIADIENDLLGDMTPEEIEAGTVGGIWFPNQMDEDDQEFAINFPIYAAAILEASKPGRKQCSYRKKHLTKRLTYYGITSAPPNGSCITAVENRSKAHERTWRFKRAGPWNPSRLDKETNVGGTVLGTTLIARQVIRGREQQLIDEVIRLYPYRGYEQGLDDPDVFNRIRSVAKANKLGCAYWLASNAIFPFDSPVGPFTGFDNLRGAPVTGCSNQ